MKKLITPNYTFDASAGTVDIPALSSFDLENILLITNVTDNIIIYNFASPSKGGTFSGTLLTLTYDTSSMSDTDRLQIYIDDAENLATSDNQDTEIASLSTIATNTGNNATSANQTNRSQKTQITDGTNDAGILKSDGTAGSQNAQITAGAHLAVAFTTTTVQAVGATDAANYKHVSVHIASQGTSSTITFQGSNDNTNWTSVALIPAVSTTGATVATSTTSTSIIYHGGLGYRYFRLNVTGISAGTTAGTIEFFTNFSSLVASAVAATQVGTWSVGSANATGSAIPSSIFPIGVSDGTNLVSLRSGIGSDGYATTFALSSMLGLFNGTSLDRARTVLNGTNSTGTGISATGILAQFDDTSPTSITENQFGNLRMSANRNLYGTIRDAAGNERGANVNSSNQLSVSVDNSNISSNIAQMNGTTVSMGTGATGTGVQRVVLANDSGKTLLSASGSASSSGNNTLVAAGTNKLKVYAFTLSTTSTTAVTCKFQSGAGGTDLWSVILQAPTSTSTGANLVVQPPAWLFATGAATLLNLNLSSANAVQWSVSYFDEA